MYKIRLVNKRTGATVKRKLYESQGQFEKWFKKHKQHHSVYNVYYVIGYKLVGGKWKPLKSF